MPFPLQKRRNLGHVADKKIYRGSGALPFGYFFAFHGMRGTGGGGPRGIGESRRQKHANDGKSMGDGR